MSGQLMGGKVTGFTLIEVMIAIAIIGILTAVAVPMYKDYIDTAQKAVMQANIRSVVLLMDSYELQEGSYPHGLTYPDAPNKYLQDVEVLAAVGWVKSISDKATYKVTVIDTGYTVEATHADGTVLRNQ
jgi:prepilin-type N-terminal cleavage/methylation domain-containing protein